MKEITAKKNFFKWLPHYKVRGQKILFLGQVSTEIKVSEELEILVEEKQVFSRTELEAIENKAVIQRLLSNGIIVPSDEIIKPIQKKSKADIIVVQPHSDDFALSCGGTLAKLYKEDSAKIKLITIFSEYSIKGFPFDEISLDNEIYTSLRKVEDINTAEYLNGTVEFLGFQDANARRSNFNVILKNGFLKNDEEMILDIFDKLKNILVDECPQKIYLPAAIGWHYDHRIVYSTMIKVLKDASVDTRVFLYEDYPYCNKKRYSYWGRLKELKDELKEITPIYVDIAKHIKTKGILINFYKSQFFNWNYKDIVKDITELASSTVIESTYLNHSQANGMVLAERLWEVIKY